MKRAPAPAGVPGDGNGAPRFVVFAELARTLDRGAYRARGREGQLLAFAVTSAGQIFPRDAIEVPPSADLQQVCNGLWRLLDALDPDPFARLGAGIVS